MITRTFGRWSIRQQVMVLGLLPLLLLGTVLSTYMISSRLQETHQAMVEKGQALAIYMAAASELALYAQDIQALRKLSRKALADPDIVDVIFLDPLGRVLLRSSTRQLDFELAHRHLNSNFTQPHRHGSYWLGQAEVSSDALQIDDFDELALGGDLAAPARARRLGWVTVVLSDSTHQARQTEILRNSLLIALACLALTWLLALYLGRRITRPILRLAGRMQAVSRGALPEPIDREALTPSHEVRVLEQGFNELGNWMRLSNEDLEERIRAATLELHRAMGRLEEQNRALERARSEAESASQAKDQFVARMSHELRTPLTSILGFVDLMQNTELSVGQREYLSIVQRTSRLLLGLIDDILAFSKLNSDAIQLEQIPFTLESCLEDVIEMESGLAFEKGLDLVFVYDPQIPNRLEGDPTRLCQVLTNLLSNAIKFTERGRISVYVNQTARVGRHCCLEIRVSDSGVGISRSDLANLFTPFSQADTTITRRFGGTGLGLVIVERLVTLMGGEIQISSEPNQGTEVRIQLRLPLALGAQAQKPATQMQALAYDSSPVAAQSLARLLSQWSHQVTATSSQQELLRELQGNPEMDLLVIGLRNGSLYEAFNRELLGRIRAHYQGTLFLMVRGPERDNPLPLDADPRLQPCEVIFYPFARRKLLERLDLLLHDRQPPASLPVTGQFDSNRFAGLHLLLAEDNGFNRLLLEKILNKFGIRHTSVKNGLEAFLACQKQTFDLLLIDVHMPLLDGGEAALRIRQISPHYQQVPIVVLTADVVAAEQQHLMNARVAAILHKPINEQKLYQTLATATGRDPASPAGTSPEGIDLEGLGIGPEEFHAELRRQVSALREGFVAGDSVRLRDHSHQLLGLAGVLDMVDVEAASLAFNRAVKEAGVREIWQALWRLERTLRGYLQPGPAHPPASAQAPEDPPPLTCKK